MKMDVYVTIMPLLTVGGHREQGPAEVAGPPACNNRPARAYSGR